jgi:Epoxide hydrolase N terminus
MDDKTDSIDPVTIIEDTEVRPFRVDVPQEAIDDLRRRIESTRWPSKELVQDRSQGVQLATLQALARYWTTEHDWRKTEARLNALPQFTTEIDGVNIHFIHVRSRSASLPSPARSGGLRVAGSRTRTPMSATSTRWTRAATSRHGRSRASSRRRCEPRSVHCADVRWMMLDTVALLRGVDDRVHRPLTRQITAQTATTPTSSPLKLRTL